MRYYKPDGTYDDHPLDTEFGWTFSDIAIDEATTNYQQQNEEIKETSKRQRSSSRSKNCDGNKTQGNVVIKSEIGDEVDGSSDVEESVDVLEDMEYFASSSHFRPIEQESIDVVEIHPLPLIHKIEPNVKEQTPKNAVVYQQSVEGFIENKESDFFKQVQNAKIPSKDAMMALINPVNPESKALLSTISYTKYKRLNDKDTSEDVLKSINFKTTNSKRLISERNNFEISPFKNGNRNYWPNNGRLPDFLLNVTEIDADMQLASEIQNYHATKEDNMLSLMMELIITDMDSNLGDMSELNHSVNELNSTTGAVMETSDLGNSIHSSIMSKEGNGFKERIDKKNYLNVPNRSDILSSIGLSDDIDRSIENFVHEKTEMHQQLCNIKKSFEADEKKIDALLDEASALQNDLRETTYLDNLIHLLEGNPEKVKNKKLPFRIFHQSGDGEETNQNFII